MATHGQAGKFTACIAEAEADSPWTPFHVDAGFAAGDSTVTVIGASAPHNVFTYGCETGAEILDQFVGAMTGLGHNNIIFPTGPLLVVSPEHAATLAQDGIGKAESARPCSSMRAFRSRASRTAPSKDCGIGARAGSPRSAIPITSASPTGRRTCNIVVAGGAGIHSLFVPTAFSFRPVTRRIGRPKWRRTPTRAETRASAAFGALGPPARLGAGIGLATPVRADDPAVVEGAKKEAKLVIYTGVERAAAQFSSMRSRRSTRSSPPRPCGHPPPSWRPGSTPRSRPTGCRATSSSSRSSTSTTSLQQRGELLRYDLPQYAAYPKEYSAPGYWAASGLSNIIIMLNTRKVDEANVPQSWWDLDQALLEEQADHRQSRGLRHRLQLADRHRGRRAPRLEVHRGARQEQAGARARPRRHGPEGRRRRICRRGRNVGLPSQEHPRRRRLGSGARRLAEGRRAERALDHRHSQARPAPECGTPVPRFPAVPGGPGALRPDHGLDLGARRRRLPRVQGNAARGRRF